MTSPFLPWRSLLYVPAHNQKFIAGAAGRGADAVVLDLEDSVPYGHKEEARRGLASAVTQVGEDGTDILVRVNRPWRLAWRDLEAVMGAQGVGAILLPKVESAAQVSVIAEYLSELENAHGLQRTMRIIPLIESARGMLAAKDILQASARICAVIPGNEDLATELEVEPEPAPLCFISTCP